MTRDVDDHDLQPHLLTPRPCWRCRPPIGLDMNPARMLGLGSKHALAQVANLRLGGVKLALELGDPGARCTDLGVVRALHPLHPGYRLAVQGSVG